MGLIETLGGRRTSPDANLFTYAFEGHARFATPLGLLFEATARETVSAVTSELTLAEVLVRPFREGRPDVVERYRRRLQPQGGLAVPPVTSEVLIEAARLRAAFPALKLPDAVHAATARRHGCAVFLTNDTRVPDLPGLEVVRLSEVADG